LSGWGGAGAFSDGKLTLSTEVGGWLNQYISLEELEKLIDYVDKIYLKFGATRHVYGGDLEKVEEIERKASLAGLKFVRQKFAKKYGIWARRNVLKLFVKCGKRWMARLSLNPKKMLRGS